MTILCKWPLHSIKEQSTKRQNIHVLVWTNYMKFLFPCKLTYLQTKSYSTQLIKNVKLTNIFLKVVKWTSENYTDIQILSRWKAVKRVSANKI